MFDLQEWWVCDAEMAYARKALAEDALAFFRRNPSRSHVVLGDLPAKVAGPPLTHQRLIACARFDRAKRRLHISVAALHKDAAHYFRDCDERGAFACLQATYRGLDWRYAQDFREVGSQWQAGPAECRGRV